MEQSTVTQAQTQIQDDLPSWHSEVSEWWDKRIKPFVDLKSFLRQRGQILKHPELTYASDAPDQHWKKPFEFALSATLLSFAFIALMGLIFHTVFPEPDLKHDWITKKLTAVIATTDKQLQALSKSDPRYAQLTEFRARAKDDLDFHTSGMKVPHGEVYSTIGVPLIVYLMGVLFPLFLRMTRARSAPRAAKAREIIYYYFAARTFWPMFLLVTAMGGVMFLLKYGIAYGGNAFDQMLPVTSGPAYIVLFCIAAVLGMAFMYAFFATPVVVHKVARTVPTLLGIEDRATHIELYWAIWITLLLATFFAMILASFLIWGYIGLDAGTDNLHHFVGRVVLTS